MHVAVSPFVAHPPKALAPTPLFDLDVKVGDGVRGLSRVINVLALLEITPIELSASWRDDILEVAARFAAGGSAARLGLQRLRALPCVRNASLSARNFEAAAFLTPVC